MQFDICPIFMGEWAKKIEKETGLINHWNNGIFSERLSIMLGANYVF